MKLYTVLHFMLAANSAASSHSPYLHPITKDHSTVVETHITTLAVPSNFPFRTLLTNFPDQHPLLFHALDGLLTTRIVHVRDAQSHRATAATSISIVDIGQTLKLCWQQGDWLGECINCFNQGSLDLSVQQDLQQTFHNFCGTHQPSLYLFLFNILDFLQKAHKPTSFSALHGPITEVTTLSKFFTPAPGLNEIAGNTDSFPSKGTVGAPFPSLLITQLPQNWPYIKYGVARKAGQHTTWTLTDDNGVPAAHVVASLGWFPRPLGKGTRIPSIERILSNIPSGTSSSPSTKSFETATPAGPSLSQSPVNQPTVSLIPMITLTKTFEESSSSDTATFPFSATFETAHLTSSSMALNPDGVPPGRPMPMHTSSSIPPDPDWRWRRLISSSTTSSPGLRSPQSKSVGSC
ncbi:hypothetical protein K469DRAFT_749171 [Zopfia rhizophila CBS 207.26]|uniref:Uncharacterized protein n=1 Tax=Zopfia rhizophila CBS 207.26 TaxID=1314779 RepID=A0A6A6E6D5_9PEZI|nr:hypothetical protein K469DRAFT_749171 [Zopfia rhizophila CBS 207.26]